jgi:LacI family transcriptional regulator
MKQREATIYDIAEALKISPATVSRAFSNSNLVNKQTRKKILDVANEMGYRTNQFAKSLREQKTNTIGVLMHELNSNFMVSVLAGIEKVISETNYDIIITHSGESGKKEIANASNLFHKRVDGIIASLAFDTPNLAHFNQFINKKIPVVFFDRVEENSGGIKVIIDNFKAGFDATNHLIEQGCTRIAHFTGSLTRNVYIKRFEGYKAALKAHNIKFKEQYLIEGTLQKSSAIEAAKAIAKMKPMPDGLFVANDFSAAVCIQTLKEMGIKIPEDIAVVGFNNDAIGTIIEPHLSTIDYPGVSVGEVAARQLLNHLKGEANVADMNTIILRSELIVRASSLRKKIINEQK